MDHELLLASTRRHFFRQSGFGIGGAALAGLLNASELAAPKAKAKSVIFLFMAGAPSQVDLLDPKPMLQKYDGQNVPKELTNGERFAFIKGTPKLLGSPFEFKRSDLHEHRLPDYWTAQHGFVDDLWAGQRVQGSARVCGFDLGRKSARRRQGLLGQRVSAVNVSGRGVPFTRRPGLVFDEPGRRLG